MSIPTSLIVVLLVVAWLVVLVPMIARRRERVPEAEPTGSNFRVLRRASASLRRRPGRGAKGRTVNDMARQGDTTPDQTADVLVKVGADPESEPADAAEEWAAAQAARVRSVAPVPSAPEVADPGPGPGPGPDVDADVDADLDGDQVALWNDEREPEYGRAVAMAPEHVQEQVFPDEDARHADAGVSQRVADEMDEDEWAAHAAAAPVGTFAEVDDEHLRPVPHRPGRGGFDPEAAEATRAYRYRQRRRVAMILLIATVAFSAAAAVFLQWLWIGAGLSFALLVGYLAYLRRQVRIEAMIRQRRMERLQRARQIRPEYARAPRRTRSGMSAVAPGRTVVDLDDDDPGFDDLEEFDRPMTYRRAAGQ